MSTPKRVFKLAIASEVESFKAGGKVLSSLDKADGFVHLSDRTSAPVVAGLFFTDAKDLQLLELDPAKLPGTINWIVGKMGDAGPDDAAQAGSTTTVHFLIPDGCVHVYGTEGVPMSAVVRSAPVPIGADGKHVFPEWL